MKKLKYGLFLLLALALALTTAVVYAAEVIIDQFTFSTHNATYEITDEPNFPETVCNRVSPSFGTIGNRRNLCITVYDGEEGSSGRLRVAAGTTQNMVLELSPSVTARGLAQWDGSSDNTTAIVPSLGGVDLTDGGLNDGILVRVINSDGVPVNIIVRLYTDLSNWAQRLVLLNTIVQSSPTPEVLDLFYPFAGFSGGSGTMDPANIGAVEIEMDATLQAGADLTIKLVKATSLWDFGDLPSPYPTLLTDNGARHRTTTQLRLGRSVDIEADGLPNATATGDNTNYAIGTVNDEDGVVRQPGLGGSSNNGGWTNGTVASNNGGRLDITITGGNGVPQVFMDFDGTGLTEVTLRNASGSPLPTSPWTPGTYQVYFDIPAGTFDGTNPRSIPTRVRLSSTGGLGVTGAADDGEVEDYLWSFGPTAVSLQSFTGASNSAVLPLLMVALLLSVVGAGALLYRRQLR